MAAPTVTYDQPKAAAIGASHYGFISGSINVSSYDNTHPSAGIENNFANLASVTVVIDTLSSNGYKVRWNSADGSLRAYGTQVTTAGATIYADVEVANAVNVGTMNFIAVGQMG